MPSPLTSITVVLDATGGGRAEAGPGRYGLRWMISRLVTSATNPCQLRVYQGYVSDATKIDSSKTGNADTSELNPALLLAAPDKLIFVYSAGTVGDKATCTMWGDLTR